MTVVTWAANGTYNWTCPAGVTSLDYARAWGSAGGSGSSSTHGSGSAGGGEFAQETSVAVTPGNVYTITVGVAGTAGSSGVTSTAGSPSSCVFDAVTVTAHGGARGTGTALGAGGTGSTNTTHHNGGAGAYGGSSNTGGSGGGSSAGLTAAGNAGAASTGTTGAAGGSAPTGGGAGGAGGNGSGSGSAGSSPGGAGGAAGAGTTSSGASADGQFSISYPTILAPPVATVTVAAPGPTVNAGITAAVATVAIAAPAPVVKAAVGAAVALVTILAPAPSVTGGVSVAPPVAAVTITTPAPGVQIPVSVAPPAAAVTIATPVPSIPHTGVLAAVAPVTITAPVPHLATAISAARAAVTVATPVPHVGSGAGPPAATVSVTPPAPSFSSGRNLLVAIASQAGTDDFGNLFPAGFFTSAGVILLYNGPAGPDTLFYSNSPAGGMDGYGNIYPQGEAYYGISGLTGLFTIEDGNGNTLAAIDSGGNITGQTISATNDVIIAGSSFLNTYLPPLSEGVIYRTNVLYNQSRPFPSSATSSEVVLYELDVVLTAGRDYTVHIAPIPVNLNGPGQAQLTIYYTSDGSTPTTSSSVWARSYSDVAGSNSSLPITVQLHMEYSPASIKTYRFIVSLATNGTGSGTPTWQIPSSAGIGVNIGAMWIEDGGATAPDTGLWIGSGSSGGGGGSPQTFTKTYTALHTYAYEGTNADSNPHPGFTPGALINTGGKAYQGDDQLGDNGNTSTMIVWPASVVTDLASATSVNWITMTLNNNHTWYSAGMTICVGKHNGSAGGSTRPTYSDPNLVQHSVSSGATINFSLSAQLTAFANALENGNPFVLYNPTSSRNYYGYFAGGAQTGPPQITVNYTT